MGYSPPSLKSKKTKQNKTEYVSTGWLEIKDVWMGCLVVDVVGWWTCEACWCWLWFCPPLKTTFVLVAIETGVAAADTRPLEAAVEATVEATERMTVGDRLCWCCSTNAEPLAMDWLLFDLLLLVILPQLATAEMPHPRERMMNYEVRKYEIRCARLGIHYIYIANFCFKTHNFLFYEVWSSGVCV